MQVMRNGSEERDDQLRWQSAADDGTTRQSRGWAAEVRSAYTAPQSDSKDGKGKGPARD